MSNINCESCESLRNDAPMFVVNGLGDDECTSLANDTGLSTTSGNNDCTDLNNMNDCMVGNMATEIAAYDVCDWKTFMKKFIPNTWTVIKGIICAVCGIWTNIHKIWCILDNMTHGFSMNIGEEETEDSYVVAGKGISFYNTGGGSRETDVSMIYVAGGLLEVAGSLKFYTDNFTDEAACWNYDNGGANAQKSANRKGNSVWNNTTGTTVPCEAGGELLYEIRIKKSAYPHIKRLFPGNASPTGGGAYQVNLTFFDEGAEAYGQHGNSDTKHTVPAGWIYVQARMINISYLHAAGTRYSPRGFMGIRFNEDEIPC